MGFNQADAAVTFTIRAVDSIPCDLKGQIVAFDAEGRLISEPVKTPWPMPWVTEELTKLATGQVPMPDKNSFKVYNPEESDQWIFVEVIKA